MGIMVYELLVLLLCWKLLVLTHILLDHLVEGMSKNLRVVRRCSLFKLFSQLDNLAALLNRLPLVLPLLRILLLVAAEVDGVLFWGLRNSQTSFPEIRNMFLRRRIIIRCTRRD